jgi:hypothetical protein
VAFRDRVISIIRPLCTANDMAPPCTNLRTGRNANYSAVRMFDVFVAGERSIVDVGDWVIGVWCANAFQLPLVDTVNGHFLEDSVSSDAACQSGSGNESELHVGDGRT